MANVISTSPLAMDLAAVLLEDGVVKELIRTNNYSVSLNTKFQVGIKNTTPAEGRAGAANAQPVSEKEGDKEAGE